MHVQKRNPKEARNLQPIKICKTYSNMNKVFENMLSTSSTKLYAHSNDNMSTTMNWNKQKECAQTVPIGPCVLKSDAAKMPRACPGHAQRRSR